MPIYVVPIEIKTREDYEVEAISPAQAAYKAAMHIVDGGEPTRRVELGRLIRRPTVVLSDDVVSEEED